MLRESGPWHLHLRAMSKVPKNKNVSWVSVASVASKWRRRVASGLEEFSLCAASSLSALSASEFVSCNVLKTSAS